MLRILSLSAVLLAPVAVIAQTPVMINAVPANPVVKQITVPNGPAVPDTAPAEPAHPASYLLWPNGAPGSEAFKNEPEHVGWREEDIVFPIVYNIHDPNITPYFPAKDKATGAAVIIAPGGGHMQLTIGREGYDLGQWLADHGVAAFVLKYRLARDTEGRRPQPYTVMDHALADAQRSIRFVRSHAREWGIDPNRVGFVGFSAGAEVAIDTGLSEGKGNPEATDPIDRLDAHPNFLGIAYGSAPQLRPADWAPPAFFPPSFLLCASNDPSPNVSGPIGVTKIYLALKAARIPVELHIFEEGGHGFGARVWDYSVSNWPTLFRAWMNDRGYLKKASN